MINSIKSLKRMKLMAFLIILQLSISLMLVNSTSSLIQANIRKLDGFESLMNFKKTYLIRVVNPNAAEDRESVKESNETDIRPYEMVYKSREFNTGLDALKDKGIIKNVFFNYPTLGLFSELLGEKYSKLSQDEQFNYDVNMIVNYDFINSYNLPIYEGRQFTKEDFNIDYKNKTIPIIMGKEYMNKIKLGDIITKELPIEKAFLLNQKDFTESGALEQVSLNLQFEVIGFYDTDAIPVMLSKNSFIENVKFSDAYVIIPCVKNYYMLNEDLITRDFGAFVEVDTPMDLEVIKKELGPKLKENGLEIRITDLTKESDKIKEVMFKDVINSAVLGGILMILSVIGITSVLLGELSERKKEFGIRIACGAEIRTLCKEMIIEIGLMVGMSSVISIVSILIKQLKYTEGAVINFNIILINIIVIGIVTLIVSVLPIMKLRKMNPVDLVRGE